MNASWQDIAVICAVLVAFAYVVRKVWRRLFSSNPSRCDACRQRPREPITRQLISIDAPGTKADD